MSERYRQLAAEVKCGSQRALAQALSLVENSWQEAQNILAELRPIKVQPQVIGVTGPPGAGKSTLVDHLARSYHQSGKRVAVLAVDPSSPFSGGAILGDRVRMALAEEIPQLFIRSMATRGALGGLARAARDMTTLLAAAGYEIILLETVGVGQAEVDIASVAHSVLVVLVPGLGDSVQALKAGVLEIADIFVLNKADRPGIDALERDLKLVLSLGDKDSAAWRVPLVRTIASEPRGIEELIKEIDLHYAWQAKLPTIQERKQKALLADLKQITFDHFWSLIPVEKLEQVLNALGRREIGVGDALERLLAKK